ncbi:MAG: methylmalonyl-CoA mutase, large subunit [Dehalococcoidia bacterium]|nr:methylmalonyl-CoA mutase, large subunit [Dehalococcoidia bacterium]
MSGIDNTPKKEVVLPSGIKVKPIYGPEDVKGMDYKRDLGDAGEYPYTRGIYPLMYRDRPWIIRQYSGFSAGEDTNTRLKFLMQRGVTGLSLAFGLPSQMGLDSDHPLAEDEVGRAGVAIDTLRDMEDIFNGIPGIPAPEPKSRTTLCGTSESTLPIPSDGNTCRIARSLRSRGDIRLVFSDAAWRRRQYSRRAAR